MFGKIGIQSKELGEISEEKGYDSKESLDKGIDLIVDGLRFLIENKAEIMAGWEVSDQETIYKIYQSIEKGIIPYTSDVVDLIDIDDKED